MGKAEGSPGGSAGCSGVSRRISPRRKRFTDAPGYSPEPGELGGERTPEALMGFGNLWQRSPMGSFQSSYSDWQQWDWENVLSDGIDAYGSFHLPDRGFEELETIAQRGDPGRHELSGGPDHRERGMAEGGADPSSGLRVSEESEDEVQEFYSTSEDLEDLYYELAAEGDLDSARRSSEETGHSVVSLWSYW